MRCRGVYVCLCVGVVGMKMMMGMVMVGACGARAVGVGRAVIEAERARGVGKNIAKWGGRYVCDGRGRDRAAGGQGHMCVMGQGSGSRGPQPEVCV